MVINNQTNKRKITTPPLLGLIALFTVFVSLGLGIISVKNQLSAIERQIEHMEEEVHEAESGVSRLLNRDIIGPSKSNSSALQPKAQLALTEYDFGKISKKDKAVTTDFAIKNIGKGELLIGEITTSCSCTSAKASGNKASPNEKLVITVQFDPNVHEEPEGRFSRSVFVPTNDPANKEIEFKIFAEIKD